MKSFTFSAYGNVHVWADGTTQKVVAGVKQEDGLTTYTVQLSDPVPSGSQMLLKIGFQPGFRGMAVIPEYMEQNCGKGSMALGDWSETDGLRAYSGGALYRKSITLSPEMLKKRLVIDLGDLVSSAELMVNGKSAGIRLAPPLTFEVTPLARAGKNTIEVLVYNTLANNYTTIPTMYRGSIRSGLMGPVSILVLEQKF